MANMNYLNISRNQFEFDDEDQQEAENQEDEEVKNYNLKITQANNEDSNRVSECK
jgi:hypothetical protein